MFYFDIFCDEIRLTCYIQATKIPRINLSLTQQQEQSPNRLIRTFQIDLPIFCLPYRPLQATLVTFLDNFLFRFVIFLSTSKDYLTETGQTMPKS